MRSQYYFICEYYFICDPDMTLGRCCDDVKLQQQINQHFFPEVD